MPEQQLGFPFAGVHISRQL